MRGLLGRHTDIAIFLILFLEELGIPMPIPADVMVMYAGYRLHQHTINPFVAIGIIVLGANVGACVLYAVVRRGGRPLVDRFGHYLHLDARKLARAEHWLERRGVLGVIVGRSIPGVRLATVIACGLFKVPLRVFLPGQIVGSSIYMIVFGLLGYYVGPQAVERLHWSTDSLRLILLLVLAIGLPLLLRRLNRDTITDDTRSIQEGLTLRQRMLAALAAGFVGTIELTTIWAIAASLTNLMRRADIQSAALRLARWLDLDERANSVAIAYTLDYLAVLVVSLLVAALFFERLMPTVQLRPRQLIRQALALWGCMLLLAGAAVSGSIVNHVVRHPAQGNMWLSQSGGIVVGIIALGLAGYAYVAVEARRLAIDQFSDDPILAPSVVAAVEEDQVDEADQLPSGTALPKRGTVSGETLLDTTIHSGQGLP